MNEMKKYRTILADPPWNERGAGKIKRGADRHYDLMTTKEIKELGGFVRKLTHPEGCHLYLWVTNNYLQDGFKVMDAWGFNYITIITWVKKRMGLGQYYRGLSEHCLFGRTDKILPYQSKDGKRQQGKTAFIEPKGNHSEKPEKVRRWIEKVSHPPRIELFARERTTGWDVWGDEVSEKDIRITLGDF